jgi:hypothetical protein
MHFTDSFLNELRNAVSITDVVGQYVTWDKEKSIPSKGDLWACCPFHSEATPSFHAEAQKGLYHCFGCGVSGDHFAFLMDSQGKTFPEAVELVAELAGIPLPVDRPEPREAPPVREAEDPGPIEEKAETKGKKIVAAMYDYTDRDGEFLYQVVRFQFKLPDGSWELGKLGTPKKTFAQRRKVNGQALWNLEGVGHTIWRHHLVEAAIAEGKTIYLPEGEKDVETLERWGLVASTNSGGAKNWTPEMAALLKDADVVILGDDDAAGLARIQSVAYSLKGIARRIRMIGKWGGPKDVTDWKDAGGSLDQLQALVDQLLEWMPAPPPSRLGAKHLSDVAHGRVAYDWLIKGLIERQGIFVVVGEEQSGKSFFMIDMGMKIARGVDYGDRKVKQGLVIYMAREDARGVQMRVEGYLRDKDLAGEGVPFVVMGSDVEGEQKFSLMDDASVDLLIDECLALEQFYGVNLELVIIDTYSASTEGLDEIKSAEVGKVQGRINRIVSRTGAAVGIAHHFNAEGLRVRGHTSITANISQVIEIRPLTKFQHNRKAPPEFVQDSEGRMIRRAFLKKNKNGPNRIGWNFVLRTLKLGTDADGYDITTCVLDRPSSEVTDSEPATGKLSADQKLVFDALLAALQDESVPMPAGARTSVTRAVSEKAFVDRVRKTWSFKATEIEARNKELAGVMKRNVTALINSGWMGRDTDLKVVWSLGKEDRPPRRASKPAEKPQALPSEVRETLKPGEPPF